MGFKEINIKDLTDNFEKIISQEWMLVTAGDKEGYNMMTASWGSIGEMWGKPCAVTVIRPQRYTKTFLDQTDHFSLSFYGDLKSIHQVCGSKSGREVDKTKETGLTPVFADNTVYFEQARLVLICKKAYVQEMKPEYFVDRSLIDQWYPQKDFHFAYVGIIEKVLCKE